MVRDARWRDGLNNNERKVENCTPNYKIYELILAFFSLNVMYFLKFLKNSGQLLHVKVEISIFCSAHVC